jgi:hypothetical protein
MLTPPRIDDPNLFRLIQIVSPGAKPVNVPVTPDEKSAVNGCLKNVAAKVAQNGGRRVLGWEVWVEPYMIEAEFHAVWESPEQQWTDITLKALPVSEIVFIPDEKAVYQGNQIDNVRLNIIGNQIVDEYIALAEAKFSMLNAGEKANMEEVKLVGKEIDIMRGIMANMLGIERMLKQGHSRNSPCFCSSNLKYKHCHGKDIISYANRIKAGSY